MHIKLRNTTQCTPSAPAFKHLFSVADIEAFFAVFADAFSKISVIVAVLLLKEKMPKEIVLGRILPGIAVGSIAGCLFYFLQARRLGIKENRCDVTALPFGVSSTHVFTWLFIIIVPVFRQTKDAHFAWQVALASGFIGGLIEFAGVFFARAVRKLLPQSVLLCNMAAASLIWLSFNSMVSIFNKPAIAVLPLFVAFFMFSYHKNLVRFVPNAVFVLIVGMIAAWFTKDISIEELQKAASNVGWYPPRLFISDIVAGITYIKPYLSLIIPLQIGNFLVTVQSVESAHSTGDAFNLRESLFYDGLTTLLSACFGSPFPTTVYYGHQGWKSRGARSGYMLLLLIPYILMFFGLSLFFLAVFPFEVLIVFLLVAGVTVAVKVENTLNENCSILTYLSLFPLFAQYVVSLFGTVPLPPHIAAGLLCLSNGAFASSLLYSLWMHDVLKGQYRAAGGISFVLAFLSSIGFIHQPALQVLAPGSIPFILAYAALGLLCMHVCYKNNRGKEAVSQCTN